jgi:hypothetical protein
MIPPKTTPAENFARDASRADVAASATVRRVHGHKPSMVERYRRVFLITDQLLQRLHSGEHKATAPAAPPAQRPGGTCAAPVLAGRKTRMGLPALMPAQNLLLAPTRVSLPPRSRARAIATTAFERHDEGTNDPFRRVRPNLRSSPRGTCSEYGTGPGVTDRLFFFVDGFADRQFFSANVPPARG